MYAEFDESLVTGNEMIDSQHKELIAKINSLVESCEKDGGKVAAIKMLDYLAEYTEFHFNAEENNEAKEGRNISEENISCSRRTSRDVRGAGRTDRRVCRAGK
jgi:hemerythrin-like metal-binding protein